MKAIFFAILFLNFCQPKAATLQISGLVPEQIIYQRHDGHHQFSIHPRHECQVFYAPIVKHQEPKWQPINRPTKVKSSCYVKVVSL